MRLAKLTGLERDALIAEIKEVGALIARSRTSWQRPVADGGRGRRS
jgi:hypothetical protein